MREDNLLAIRHRKYILTTDSQLAVRLTEPGHRVPKTYHVTVRGAPAVRTLVQLRHGIDYGEGRTRPAGVTLLEQGPKTALVEMVLTEGRNRQVRRMWAAVGHRVKRLVRVAIGGLRLGDLPVGSCRPLSATEVAKLLTTER